MKKVGVVGRQEFPCKKGRLNWDRKAVYYGSKFAVNSGNSGQKASHKYTAQSMGMGVHKK